MRNNPMNAIRCDPTKVAIGYPELIDTWAVVRNYTYRHGDRVVGKSDHRYCRQCDFMVPKPFFDRCEKAKEFFE